MSLSSCRSFVIRSLPSIDSRNASCRLSGRHVVATIHARNRARSLRARLVFSSSLASVAMTSSRLAWNFWRGTVAPTSPISGHRIRHANLRTRLRTVLIACVMTSLFSWLSIFGEVTVNENRILVELVMMYGACKPIGTAT